MSNIINKYNKYKVALIILTELNETNYDIVTLVNQHDNLMINILISTNKPIITPDNVKIISDQTGRINSINKFIAESDYDYYTFITDKIMINCDVLYNVINDNCNNNFIYSKKSQENYEYDNEYDKEYYNKLRLTDIIYKWNCINFYLFKKDIFNKVKLDQNLSNCHEWDFVWRMFKFQKDEIKNVQSDLFIRVYGENNNNNKNALFRKNLKMGLAISTYTDENTNPERINIIRKSLNSLRSIVPPNVMVIIVVDGSCNKEHVNLLFESGFKFIMLKENEGVSSVKNVGIQYLLDKEIDIGFLADDDILYKMGVFDEYAKYIINTNFHHFGFYPYKDHRTFPTTNHPITINDVPVQGLTDSSGIFITFTPELIKKIGYFKKLPYKWGFEHIQFSRKALFQHGLNIYSQIDIPTSDNFLKIIYESCIIKSCTVDLEKAKMNLMDFYLDGYESFENIKIMDTMKKPISILIPNKNRDNLLSNTLMSINRQNYSIVEVLIFGEYNVKDLDKYKFPITIISDPDLLNCTTPVKIYNKLAKLARGELLIIQQPECYHVTNILDCVNKNSSNSNYLVFPVFALPNQDANILFEKLISGNSETVVYKGFVNMMMEKIEQLKLNYHYCKGWYHNSQYNNSCLNFLSAISRENFDNMLGFDERYWDGHWYYNNEFLERVKLFLQIQSQDDHLCIHQWHSGGSVDVANSMHDQIILTKTIQNKNRFENFKCNNNKHIVWTLNN